MEQIAASYLVTRLEYIQPEFDMFKYFIVMLIASVLLNGWQYKQHQRYIVKSAKTIAVSEQIIEDQQKTIAELELKIKNAQLNIKELIQTSNEIERKYHEQEKQLTELRPKALKVGKRRTLVQKRANNVWQKWTEQLRDETKN